MGELRHFHIRYESIGKSTSFSKTQSLESEQFNTIQKYCGIIISTWMKSLKCLLYYQKSSIEGIVTHNITNGYCFSLLSEITSLYNNETTTSCWPWQKPFIVSSIPRVPENWNECLSFMNHVDQIICHREIQLRLLVNQFLITMNILEKE